MLLDISSEQNIYNVFVLIIIRTKDEVGTIKLVEAFQLFFTARFPEALLTQADHLLKCQT